MHRLVTFVALCWVLLLVAAVAVAQDADTHNLASASSRESHSADAHLLSDPARQLYKSCAYAHGYIHGYEDGFHQADLDIHMGHEPRAVTEFNAYRSAPEYRRDFGNRNFFRLGYRQGFRAAYADGMRGGRFRGLISVRRAAEGFSGESAEAKEFEQAFSAGYDGGYTEGTQRPPFRNSQNIAEQCLAEHHTAAYCDAYSRGFQLGYSDGSANPRQMQTAEKK